MKAYIFPALALAALGLVGAGCWLTWGPGWCMIVTGGMLWADLFALGLRGEK